MAYRTVDPDPLDGSSAVCPVVNADAFFPRPHPSAASAFTVAVASLGLGALAGIPAILLGRLVLREIADGNGRYTGERDARLGLTLGWVSTLASFALLSFVVASSVAAVGLVLVVFGVLPAGAAVAGKFWAAAPEPLRAWGAKTGRSAWPFWAAALAAIISGGAGFAEKRQTDERLRIEAAATCAQGTWLATEATTRNLFDDAHSHLRVARGSCVGAELLRAEQLDAGLPAKEVEFRRRRDQEQAEKEVRLTAENEQRAQAMFDERTAGILERLNSAAAMTTQRRWLDAQNELARTAALLQDFGGTKVETSERWLRFKARLAELREKIAPGVQQAEKAREAVEEAKRKREEALQKAREAAEAAREASRRVQCCDNSLSPSCLCNGPHRGCCSHHGGICGCEP
jgi:hypothetical protein